MRLFCFIYFVIIHLAMHFWRGSVLLGALVAGLAQANDNDSEYLLSVLTPCGLMADTARVLL